MPEPTGPAPEIQKPFVSHETSLLGCRTIGNMGSFSIITIYLSISRVVTDLTKSILSPVNPDIIDSMLICIRGC